MDAGDETDLDVTSVAHGGVFVGRIGDPADDSGRGGRVVFVPDAIPGERVRIRLTDVGKKSFWRGEVLEVLEASPHRQPHVWRQADFSVPPHLRPGGADFGHIELSHQRALKLEVLTDALKRFGGIERADVPMHAATGAEGEAESADGSGWRTRVSLHVDADGYVGPFAARSHSVIAVEDYPLATPEVERAALALHEGRAGAHRSGAARRRPGARDPARGCGQERAARSARDHHRERGRTRVPRRCRRILAGAPPRGGDSRQRRAARDTGGGRRLRRGGR